MQIGKQMQFFQEQVRPFLHLCAILCQCDCQIYEGKIKDEQAESLSTYFYDQPTTDKKRNRYIYPTATGGLKIVNMVELFARTGFEAFVAVEGKGSAFVYPREYTSYGLVKFLGMLI